jgi:hypothetical protein
MYSPFEIAKPFYIRLLLAIKGLDNSLECLNPKCLDLGLYSQDPI